MVVKILGWLALVILNSIVDWKIITRDKTYVNHLLEFVFRSMAAIMYGAIVFDVQIVGWLGWDAFHYLSFAACSFYIVFELLLNWFRGLAWDYLGSKSKWDIFFLRHRTAFYLLKLACAVLLVWNVHYLITVYGR